MGSRVRVIGGGYRLAGDDPFAVVVNRFLEHLVVRNFSPATVRTYAFDLPTSSSSSMQDRWR